MPAAGSSRASARRRCRCGWCSASSRARRTRCRAPVEPAPERPRRSRRRRTARWRGSRRLTSYSLRWHYPDQVHGSRASLGLSHVGTPVARRLALSSPAWRPGMRSGPAATSASSPTGRIADADLDRILEAGQARAVVAQLAAVGLRARDGPRAAARAGEGLARRRRTSPAPRPRSCSSARCWTRRRSATGCSTTTARRR